MFNINFDNQSTLFDNQNILQSKYFVNKLIVNIIQIYIHNYTKKFLYSNFFKIIGNVFKNLFFKTI
jgi:hypothetical protein